MLLQEPDLLASDLRAASVTASDSLRTIGVAVTWRVKANLVERRADFEAEAEQRYARIVETGKTIPWNEMRGYLEARIAGKQARCPAARKLAK